MRDERNDTETNPDNDGSEEEEQAAVANAIHQNPGGSLEEESPQTQQRCCYTNLVVPPMRFPEKSIEYRQHNTDRFCLKEVRRIEPEPALPRW